MSNDTDIFDELEDENKKKTGFDFEDFIERNKLILAILLFGLILAGVGVFLYKDGIFDSSNKVEIINEPTQSRTQFSEIVVEISGAVEKPGVYKLNTGSRIEDLLIASGGLSADADRDWFEKNINRAGKLTDGQKLYIVKISDSQSNVLSANSKGGYQTVSSGNYANSEEKVNINTATLGQLDSLPGIGPVYGQNIIEQRPYSKTDDLIIRGVIKQSLYDKIKDKITI